jgi:hypothetical protein
MKLYLDANRIPDAMQLSSWQSTFQQFKMQLQTFKVSLSMEERQGKRKMGPRRLAYAQASEKRGVQHEDVMPRTFTAAHFTRLIQFHTELSRMLAQVEELHKILDDTLMAAGIDAMTYTKLVHDGLRSSNTINPALDGALRELDEFNKRAQLEEEEEAAVEVV